MAPASTEKRAAPAARGAELLGARGRYEALVAVGEMFPHAGDRLAVELRENVVENDDRPLPPLLENSERLGELEDEGGEPFAPLRSVAPQLR